MEQNAQSTADSIDTLIFVEVNCFEVNGTRGHDFEPLKCILNSNRPK